MYVIVCMCKLNTWSNNTYIAITHMRILPGGGCDGVVMDGVGDNVTAPTYVSTINIYVYTCMYTY